MSQILSERDWSALAPDQYVVHGRRRLLYKVLDRSTPRLDDGRTWTGEVVLLPVFAELVRSGAGPDAPAPGRVDLLFFEPASWQFVHRNELLRLLSSSAGWLPVSDIERRPGPA